MTRTGRLLSARHRRLLGRCALALLLLGCGIAAPAQARPLRGKAGLIVRDAVSGRPLAGASVSLTAVVVRRKTTASEPAEERIAVDGNTLTTDASGFGLANIHLGESSGDTRRLETSEVAVRAELPGYRPLERVVRAYYAAFDPPRLVLEDVLLAPTSAERESSVEPQLLRPEARVEPEYGEEGQSFTVRVRVHVPKSLALVFPDAGKRSHSGLLHVFVQETDGTTGTNPHRAEKGYRRDLAELTPDAPGARGRADVTEYSGQIRHATADDGAVIDHLHLAIRAAEPGDYLLTAEGDHVPFTETKTRTGLLERSMRFNTVLLTVLNVPVRWAVGRTADAARQAFERKFADPPVSPR